jgi:type IV fimbrial biogenesis protein FimT
MYESTAARRRPFGHGAGFTIIELMITVALASILLAVAVPSFTQMIVGNRLTTQTNDMVAAISLARSEAIKRNANVTLCRAASNLTDCVTASGTWQNWVIRTTAGIVVRQGSVNTFGGTLAMRSTLANDQVVFGPDGLARTNNVMVADHTITVCSQRRIDRNVREIIMGRGSRTSTRSATTTTCTA